MINLLPLKQKKSLYHLLIMREVNISIGVLLWVGFVLIIFLSPVYLYLQSKTKSVNSELENIKNSESFTADKDMNATIDDINNKLAIFPTNFEEIYPTADVILPLTAHRVPGISITGISYEKIAPVIDPKTKQPIPARSDLEVRGVAKNRLALLAFQKSLESEPGYTKVVLPISDFVKGKDITFSILITTNL